MAKKYHPDKYQNNPLADLAAEKMREINAAYDILSKKGTAGSQGGYSNAYNSSGFNQNSQSSYYDVRTAIQTGDLNRAYSMLINSNNRNAEWYFLMGVVEYSMGRFDDGTRNIQTAISMDPGNQEYKQTMSTIQNSGVQFRARSMAGGYRQRSSCEDMLTCLICSSCISPCW